MAEFFKTSTLWVVDFRYDGSPRQWFVTFGTDADVAAEMTARLHALYGARAALTGVRQANAAQEQAYRRGETPVASACPTGRGPHPRQISDPPADVDAAPD